MRALVFGCIVLVLGTTACITVAGLDPGMIQQNHYKNDFFGLIVPIPEDWHIQGRVQTDGLLARGVQMTAGNDAYLRSILNSSRTGGILLAVFQYEQGSAVPSNPSLVIVGEDLTDFPGVKTGRDQLFHTRRLLRQPHLKYERVDEQSKSISIGKREFFEMDAVCVVMGKRVKQKIFSTVIKGYSLSIIVSYVTDQQEKELLRAVDMIRLE